MDKKEGEVSRFFFEVFLSHSAEKIRRGTLQGVTDFGYRKILCLGGLCHDFLSNFFVSQYQKTMDVSRFRFENFFLTVPKHIIETLLCCVSENFWKRKSLWIRRRGKYQDFPSKVFLSHSAEKIRRGTLQGVTDFGYRKVLCLGGLCHDFSSNFFVSQYRKTLQGNPSVLCFGKFLEAKSLWIRRRGKYQDFSSKFFCLTVPKKFVGEPFRVSLISGIEKFYAQEGYVTIFCRIFLSRSTKKLCRETLLCCVSENFWKRKSLWIRRRGKYQDFSSKFFCLTVPKKFVGEPFRVSLISGIEKFYAQEGYVTIFRRIFLSRSTKKLCRETLLCCVSENFWKRKSLWIRRRGKYQDFSSKFFCLTVPKKFVGEPFRVSLISGIEKFYAQEGYVTIFRRIFLSRSTKKLCRETLLCCVSENFWKRKSLWIRRRGKYQDFSSKFFCLTVPKKFVGEPFRVSLISGIEKFYAQEGYVTIFRRIFLSRSTKKLCRETLLCCVSENFWKRKSLWIRGRGKYQDFPSKVFCLTVPKKFVGEPFRVSLISGIEKFYAQEGYVTIFRRIFLSLSTEKLCRETLLCCISENFWKRKSLWIRRRGKYQDFSSKFFLSHSAEKIRRGTLQGVTDFGYRKILCLGGLCHDFSSNFFVSQYQKTLQGNPSVLCFGKFLEAKKFMDKKEGEVSRFFFEVFLSHSAEKIRRGTLQGVTDFGYRKILCLGGLCHDFSSNFFVSQYQKTLQGNPSVLCFGKFLEAKKFMDKKEGEVSRFFFEVFLSHSAEKIRRGTLQGVTDFGYRKILCLGGLCHDFSSNFFVSQYQKTLQGNPSVLCFGKFLEAKKLMDKKEGEVSRFCFEVFLSHSAEKIRRGTLQGVTDFGYRKILCLGGLCHDFSSNFSVSQYQKTLQGNPSVLCFGKFLEAKKFMDKREGEVSGFSIESFLSHSAEKICRGTLQGVDFGYRKVLCLGGLCHDFSSNFFVSQQRKICRETLLCCISENFWKRKSLWIRRRGKYQDFSSKFFCLTVPKKFVEEPFRVSLISGIEKFYAQEGYVTIFRRIFLSRSTKKLCRETLLCCVSENFWKRKSLWIRRRGKYQDFSSKFFCLTVPKKFVGEPFRVSLISGIEKFMLRRVMSRFFVEFFCLAVPKNFVGKPFCAVFRKISGSEKVYG